MTYIPSTSRTVGDIGDLLIYGLISWARQDEDVEHLWNMGENCTQCDEYFWRLIQAERSSVHPRPALHWYLRFHHTLPEHHFDPHRKGHE